MGILRTILGGVAGFAIGGPIGALLGAVAGRALDGLDGPDRAPDPRVQDGTKQIAFTIGVIALGAKMAKADGVVTRDEVAAFRRIFEVPQDEVANVGRVFDFAKRDVRGFEPYARQVAGLFPDNPEILEKLIEGLYTIAQADGVVHPAELAYLHQVAAIFGLDASRFARAGAAAGGTADPYTVLGVPRTASDEAIKTAWRGLVRENHPDRLMAQGLPPDAIALANRQVAAINAAYDIIARERGIK
ncbi:MAG: TerB family tellurite resistance protein [Rhodospirillales bacterium]